MLKALIRKYQNQIIYLIFGVLTTVVDFVVYDLFCKWSVIPQDLRATISNGIAWAVAVLFAFVTNKPFVFRSNDWSAKTVVPEFGKFVSLRLASGVFSSVMIFLFVDLLNWNHILIKALASVFVIVFNYFASKLLVFKTKNQ